LWLLPSSRRLQKYPAKCLIQARKNNNNKNKKKLACKKSFAKLPKLELELPPLTIKKYKSKIKIVNIRIFPGRNLQLSVEKLQLPVPQSF